MIEEKCENDGKDSGSMCNTKKKLDFSRLSNPNALLYEAKDQSAAQKSAKSSGMTIQIDKESEIVSSRPKTQRHASKKRIEPSKFDSIASNNSNQATNQTSSVGPSKPHNVKRVKKVIITSSGVTNMPKT